MVKKRKIFLLLIIIINILLLFCTVDASAIELNGVSLGPTVIDKQLKPGDYAEEVFFIKNFNDEVFEVQPYFQDFRVEKEVWKEVEDPDPKWSPMTWTNIISFPEKLGPKEEGEVRVGFTIPEDAELGEHVTYFSVKFVKAGTNEENNPQTNISVASEIKSLVYVTVIDPNGKFVPVRSWEINKAGIGFWQFKEPVFKIKALNTGNVQIETKGNILINDLLRNKKTNIDIPLVNILPNNEKEISLAWDDAPFLGYYEGVIKLSHDGSNFEERSFRFVTIPILSFIGLVVILGGIITSIALYITSLKKRLAALENKQKEDNKF